MAESKNSPRYSTEGKVSSVGLHEVLVTSPNGHQSVVRVVAKDKTEAQRVVADSLPGEQRRGYEVTEVAGPAEMLSREAQVQRQHLRAQAEATGG